MFKRGTSMEFSLSVKLKPKKKKEFISKKEVKVSKGIGKIMPFRKPSMRIKDSVINKLPS